MMAIYNEINVKAKESFGEDVTGENFSRYTQHWLRVARSFRDDCRSEGLTETADYINGIIDWTQAIALARIASSRLSN